MGIFDRAKDAPSSQRQQLDAAVENAGDFADEKTEGKHAKQVDKSQEMARDKLADMTADADLNARVMARFTDLFVAVRRRLADAVNRGEVHGRESASRNSRSHRVG